MVWRFERVHLPSTRTRGLVRHKREWSFRFPPEEFGGRGRWTPLGREPSRKPPQGEMPQVPSQWNRSTFGNPGLDHFPFYKGPGPERQVPCLCFLGGYLQIWFDQLMPSQGELTTRSSGYVASHWKPHPKLRDVGVHYRWNKVLGKLYRAHLVK